MKSRCIVVDKINGLGKSSRAKHDTFIRKNMGVDMFDSDLENSRPYFSGTTASSAEIHMKLRQRQHLYGNLRGWSSILNV